MGLCENDEQEHGRGGMSTFLSKLLAFRFTGSWKKVFLMLVELKKLVWMKKNMDL